MTAFIAASAVLTLLILGYVLRPIWQPRPLAGAGMLALLSLVTGLAYVLVGTPLALDPAEHNAPASFAEAITRLEAKLESDPKHLEGWQLLARSYAAESRLDESRDALARAVKHFPDEPDLLAEAAEARALAADNRELDAEAVAMLRHALDLQPMNQRARWFLGISQRQAQQPAEAARTWEPLLATVDADTADSLREQINAARGDAGLAPLQAPAIPTGSAATSPVSIKVSVSIDPVLAMRLPENAVVFVIARQPGGPPIPVAVERLSAMQLPLVVTLDDKDSLMPTAKLSDMDEVAISVRVSASGDAAPQPGDFEATPVVVATSPGAVAALLIDRVVE